MRLKCYYLLMAIFMAGFVFLWIFLPVSAAEEAFMIGGINIVKTDVLGNGLSDAGYQIAREATQEELRNSSVSKRLLKTEDEMLTVVYTSFWSSNKMEGAKVSEVVTDANGCAAIYGLPHGTYYLVESRAPEGYSRMSAPVRVTINKYSHLTAADDIRDDENKVIDNTLHIVTIRYALPDTGRNASVQIVASFTVLVISLGIMFWLIAVRKRCTI